MISSTWLHIACAALYMLLAAGIVVIRPTDRTRLCLAGACLAIALSAGGMAWRVTQPEQRLAGLLDLVQPVVWFFFIMHLYRRAVPNGSEVGRLLSAIALVAVIVVGATILFGAHDGAIAAVLPITPAVGTEARLALAVCMILLIENLYRNVLDDLRWHVVLPCIAIGGIFLYDFVLFSDAVLFRRISLVLLDGRSIVTALVAPLLALSARRDRRRWSVGIEVSHQAVFYSASLVVIGVFLVGLATAGEILRRYGEGRNGDWPLVAEVSLICGGLLAVAVFLTSQSARSALRHLVRKNFLARRYDYRLEWLRCIETLSVSGSASMLHTRAIKAVAQTVDSPAGTIFLREPEEETFRWASSWNLPAAPSSIPPDHPLVPLFRGGGWVVEASSATPWIEGWTDLWLAIPLAHGGRLLGFVLVARPRAPLALDSEVYDLLRIIGQEVASYIAEQRAAATLLDARQFQEYGQRFAFVAHDIKNVASQLSLLLANAEHHIANPEFQRDMLSTVRASVQKISALLVRLKAPAEDMAPALSGVRDRLQAIVRASDPGRRGRIDLEDDLPPGSDVDIAMAAASFDAVVAHLLDNAFEASPAGARVKIACRLTGRTLLIDVVDRGCGMTQQFIDNQLFRPFISSKRDGFGIGVYQVRELVRRAGGDLLVTSTPGRGTTMRLSMRALVAERVDEAAMQVSS